MDCREGSTKRCRTRFNSWQIQILEKVFGKTHYPDTKQMEQISIQIDIPPHKMQIWFQNRRAKWRKSARLRNFGGLASVKETEYVPAPDITNTFKSFYLQDYNVYYNSEINSEVNENNAIDLSKASLSELSPQSLPTVPEIYEKSSAYKKSGGITSIRFNDHMNAFEYPTAYYSRHYIDNKKEKPSLASFAFASNQSMSSLLFAPTLVHNKPIHSGDEYDSDIQNIQNTYINK